MNNLVAQLHDSLQQTLPYFDLGEAETSRTYAPGKWNIRQILHHLTDCETVYYDRIRRVITEPRQVIWAFDQDAWARGLHYDTLPLHINRDIYTGVRKAIVHLTENFYESMGQKEFVHSEAGVQKLKDLFDKVAAHNFHHLKQLKSALDNRS